MLRECSSGNKLVGIYRGTVLLHLPHGYCKIMIYGVYPDDWSTLPNLIPKAEQASPLFAGTNYGNGTFSYPNIGSTVWCMFANGDQNYPIYFAAALGGHNAYGLHDIVLNKADNEYSDLYGNSVSAGYLSDRHLITSGKSRIEIYENGKISAIVEQPIRTTASVDFEKDEVISRELQDKVDTEEISNLNCLLVLDNQEARGTISVSTHYWNPISNSSKQIISSLTDLTTIVDSSSGSDRFDNLMIIDNGMKNIYSAISSYTIVGNRNTTVLNAQTTELIANATNVDSKNIISTDSSNNFIVNLLHSNSNKSSYTLVDNLVRSNSKITSDNTIDEYVGKFNLKSDATAGFSIISSLLKNSVNENKDITILTSNLENYLLMNSIDGFHMQANHELTSLLQMSSGDSKLEIKKNYTSIDASNLKTSYYKLDMSGYLQSNGNDKVSSKYKKEVSTENGLNEETFNDKINLVDFSKTVNLKSGENSEIFDDKKRKVNYINSINTANGTVEIKITDKKTGKYSFILMDKDGNISIESSTSITIKAPNIKLDGITNITGKTTIDSSTIIKSSLTTIGDTTIVGSSYTGHIHKCGTTTTTPRIK